MVEKATGALLSAIDNMSKGWVIVTAIATLLFAVAGFYFNTTYRLDNIDANQKALSSAVAQIQNVSDRVHTLEDINSSRGDVIRAIQEQQNAVNSSLSNIGNQLATLTAQMTIVINGLQVPKVAK